MVFFVTRRGLFFRFTSRTRCGLARVARVACEEFASNRTWSRSASSSAGLVGLPNVGKSTLFNALVGRSLAQASNFPFTTIEPNIAMVDIPDPRLIQLSLLHKSKNVRGQQIEFYDIAGLVKGASQGAGLGNKFLENIRSVSAIAQVVRCFNDPDIIHVHDAPDPIRDIKIIELELILADLQTCEKRLGIKAKGLIGAAAESFFAEQRLLKEVKSVLEAGLPARTLLLQNKIIETDIIHWERLQLLTQKPLLYVTNVDELDAKNGNEMTRSVESFVKEKVLKNESSAIVCCVSAKIEAELALLENVHEKKEMLTAYGLDESGLDLIISSSAKLLRLQTFYTVGPQETRAWKIKIGSTAPQAAGVIHSDFEEGFIKAEVSSFEDVIKYGGDEGARKAGVCRQEGKDYIVQDGDIMLFKAGGAKKR
jgi:ribosome-binding ATPase